MVRELSRQRVLTTEFIDGVEANDRDAIIAAGLDPQEIADNAVRAAIKMILIDGYFHADPHPGNVLVNLDTGVLTFIDTGMVGELGLRQRLNLISLLYTSTKNDPEALAQSLRSLSEPFRRTDPKAFDAGFARRIGPLMDVPPDETLDLAGIIATSMDLLRDAGYRPDPQLSLAIKALTQSAEFMKVLYPPGHSGEFSAKAVEMTRELAADNLTEERIAAFAKKQATYAAREAVQQLPSLQDAANRWLHQYRQGRFEVKLDTSDLKPRIDELRTIARGTDARPARRRRARRVRNRRERPQDRAVPLAARRRTHRLRDRARRSEPCSWSSCCGARSDDRRTSSAERDRGP